MDRDSSQQIESDPFDSVSRGRDTRSKSCALCLCAVALAVCARCRYGVGPHLVHTREKTTLSLWFFQFLSSVGERAIPNHALLYRIVYELGPNSTGATKNLAIGHRSRLGRGLAGCPIQRAASSRFLRLQVAAD